MLAFVIPAGIILAVATRPEKAASQLLQANETTVLPVLLKTIDKEGYTANLRCNTDTSSLQLEWINKKVLTVPSVLVYQVQQHVGEFGHKGAFFLGKIEPTGTYYFDLQKTEKSEVDIAVYDIIKRSAIDSIHFSK